MLRSFPCFVSRLSASSVLRAGTVALLLCGVLTAGARAQTATAGLQWTSQTPTASPTARASASMAYNAANNTVVLFGGLNSAGAAVGDTWVYNGKTWTQAATTGPAARSGAAITYDQTNGNIVLFGGQNGQTYYQDTWIWNGTAWTQKSPATVPPYRANAGMTFSPLNSSVVMFGGYQINTAYSQNDLWSWNGTNWTNITPGTSPPVRFSSAFAYDAATNTIVLYGGESIVYNGISFLVSYLSDTWTYNGSTWTQQSPATVPPARYGAGTAYNPGTGTVIMFGGANGANIFGDTYGWTGTNWIAQNPYGTLPSARSNTNLALDAATNSLVLFGGQQNSTYYNDTNLYATGPYTVAATPVGSVFQNNGLTYFNVNTTGTINVQVLTQGVPNGDFVNGGTNCGGSTGSCYVAVYLNPTAVGLRRGAVNLLNTSGAILATQYVSGIGTGPQTLFQPGVLSTTISTTLNTPRGLTVDTAGNVYVANAGVNTVLKYPSGSTTPSQLASASGATSGTAVDGAGNVFFGVIGAGVYELVGGTGTAVKINSTAVNSDNNLSVDGAGNLYTSDENSGAIYELPSGNYSSAVTLVAGTGGHRFIGMALDSSGNLFAADFNTSKLYEVVAGSGALTQLYSGTPLNSPHALAVDPAGNVYVGNYGGGVVYRFAAGNYGATPVALTVPGSQSLAIGTDGSIYTVNSNSLLRYTRTASPTLSFATTPIGSTSASQTVVLENDGNSALTVPIPGSGQNPSVSANFLLSNGSTCPLVYSTSGAAGTLAAGATCTEILSYSPTTAGAVTGGLVLTDNNLNATGSKQQIKTTATTVTGLTVTAVSQNAIIATSSVSLEFTVGYGGNAAPIASPTLTVAGSSTGVGTITCNVKAGHNVCFAPYNMSALPRGTYTIVATQPGDANYVTTNATATLTVTNAAGQSTRQPGGTITAVVPVASNFRTATADRLPPGTPTLAAPVAVFALPEAGSAVLTDSSADTTDPDDSSTAKRHKR